MGYNLQQANKVLNLFTLLPNETMESWADKAKANKLGGVKVCKSNETSECFINPEIKKRTGN